MTLYLVYREGVYRHELVSISRTEADAHTNAKAAIAAEGDDYHTFTVNRVEINRVLHFPPSTRYSTRFNSERSSLLGSYSREDGPKIGVRVTYREAT